MGPTVESEFRGRVGDWDEKAETNSEDSGIGTDGTKFVGGGG